MVGHVFRGPSKLGTKDLLPARVTILFIVFMCAYTITACSYVFYILIYVSLYILLAYEVLVLYT